MGAGTGRALVADGDRVVGEEVSAHLRRDGFQVLEASSGLLVGESD
jgi:hypothetical protein